MGEISGRASEAKKEQKKFATAPLFAPAGQSSQMIIGATAATDGEILQTASELYDRYDLRRVYYSAYSPVPGSDPRLPGQAPPLVREHRLYQADWLMRFYEFDVHELTTAAQPNLSLEVDPKLAWALAHRDLFPIDVNRAERHLLLRVPGMGQKNVAKIVAARRHRRLRVADLKRLRIGWNRARAFIEAADYFPPRGLLESQYLAAKLKPRSQQRLLFDTAVSAATGEV
jgi:predicted DNA-binding helix-hairpin-helix protein